MTKRSRLNLIKRRIFLSSYEPRDHHHRPEDAIADEPLELSLRTMQSLTSSSAMAMRRPSQRRM